MQFFRSAWAVGLVCPRRPCSAAGDAPQGSVIKPMVQRLEATLLANAAAVGGAALAVEVPLPARTPAFVQTGHRPAWAMTTACVPAGAGTASKMTTRLAARLHGIDPWRGLRPRKAKFSTPAAAGKLPRFAPAIMFDDDADIQANQRANIRLPRYRRGGHSHGRAHH